MLLPCGQCVGVGRLTSRFRLSMQRFGKSEKNARCSAFAVHSPFYTETSIECVRKNRKLLPGQNRTFENKDPKNTLRRSIFVFIFQQKQEEEVEVEVASEPQATHEKVESRVVANANAAAAAAEPREHKEPPPIYPFNLVNPLDIKFCQPSEEEPHSGESKTPKSGGEDFSVSQSNLYDLLHALMCRHSVVSITKLSEEPAQCVPRCHETKILLRHMVQCEAKKNEHCHWIMCFSSDCKICSSKEVWKMCGDYFIATKATLAANEGKISNCPSLPEKSKSRDDRTKTVKQEAKTSVQPQSADLGQASGGTECIDAGLRGTSVEDTDVTVIELLGMLPHARNCMQNPKMEGGRKLKCLKKNCEELKMGKNKNKKKNKMNAESGTPKPQQQKEQEEGEVKSHGMVEDRVVANGSCEDFMKAAPTADQPKEPPLISETNVVDTHDVIISQQIMGKCKSKKEGKQQPQQQEQEEAEVEAATEPQKTHEKVGSRRVVANANAVAAAAEQKEQKELSPIYALNLVNPLAIKFCQPSEEESHSGESQMPGKGGEDFSVSQSHSYDLSHALMCQLFDTIIAVPAQKPPLIVVDPQDVTISQQMGKSKSKNEKGKQQPQQQKQEVEVEAASEPQDTNEKVESRVVAYAEEEPHSGESQTPKSGGEDFSDSQSKLCVLLHALMCRPFNTKSAVPAQCVPGCRETKILLRHMAQCEAKKNEHCNYSEYCLAYRALLGHWIMCNYLECEICSSPEIRVKVTNKYEMMTVATLTANNKSLSKTVKQEAKTSVQPQPADLGQASGDTECIDAGFSVTSIEDTDLRCNREGKLIRHADNCKENPKMKRRTVTEV
ncbi:Hypothetical predicted protein [Cloeon dipterum]|uniref:histone acetyltransferase n=1 Tax=Cloeon dipterum TaxID=197152 RepID=A0A8S1CDY5_9INSE|nr:Hypothetical predicted protein [Cloeon dipterum]